jgi:hypothetical protein
MQNLGQSSGAATSAGSVGVAEIDDVNAVTTARAVTKVKRILSEDVIWDQELKEEDVLLLYADMDSSGYKHASLIHRESQEILMHHALALLNANDPLPHADVGPS